MLGLPFCCCPVVVVVEARSCHDDTPTFYFFFAIFSRAHSIPSGLPRLSCPALLQLHFASCCRVVSCLLAAIFSCRITPHLPLPLLDHPRPCLTNHHLIAGAARPAGASDVQHVAAIVRRAIRDPRSRFNCQEPRIMMIMIHLAISSYCLSQCCGL